MSGAPTDPESEEARVEPTPASARRAARARLLFRLLAPLLGTLTFIAAFAFGAVLHLDLPATRRAAERIVESALGDLLRGSITIDDLSRLDADGLTALGVEVKDPSGRRVLHARKLDVEVDLFGVVGRVARFFEKLSFVIDRVTLEGCSIALEDTAEKDEHGQSLGYPSLVDAFTPRTPSTTDAEGGRPVRVWLADVRLVDVSAAAHMADLPALRAKAPGARGSVLITEKGVALDVHKMDVGLSGLAPVEMVARGSLHLRSPGPLYGDLDVQLGQLALVESYRIEDGRIHIQGAAPEIRPEDARALLPSWPLDRTIAIEHELSGVPPRLTMSSTVRTERGLAKIAGQVTIAPEFEADLDVDIEDLDLTALHSSWPVTTLGARSALEIWQGKDRPHLEMNATLLPSQVEGTDVPAVDFRGTYDDRGLLVDATLHERGLPLHLDVREPPNGPLGFELELRRTRLEESPRLSRLLGVRGTLLGTVSGEWLGDRVETRTALEGAEFEYGGAEVRALRVLGTTTVPVADPTKAELNWTILARGASYQLLEIDRAEVHVKGAFAEPRVDVDATAKDGTRLVARARSRTDRFELDDVVAQVTGRGKPISLGIGHFSLHEGRLRVAKFLLESEGRLAADLDLTAAGGTVDLDGRELNMSRLAESAGLPSGTLSGRLTTRVDARLGDDSKGTIHVEVKDGEVRGLRGLDLTLDTSLEDRHADGRLSLHVDSMGDLEGTWSAELGGHPFRVASYRNVTGKSSWKLQKVDLPTLETLFLADTGVTLHQGVGSGTIEIERTKRGRLPTVHFTAKTSGLSADLGEDDALRIDGVDLNAAGSVDPDEDRVQVVLRATDYDGDVVSVGASLTLPLTTWGDEVPPLPELRELASNAPLDVAVSIPKRSIADFPGTDAGLASELSGVVAARGTVRGSLRDPALQMSLDVEKLRGPLTKLHSPLDVHTSFRFRPQSGRLEGELRAEKDALRIATLLVDVVVPEATYRGELAPNAPSWTGEAQLVLDGAPLELLEPVTEKGLRGQVQGALTIARHGFLPNLNADLRLRHLAAGGRKLGEGRVTAETADRKLIARAQLDDEYGTLTASAEVVTDPGVHVSTLAKSEPIYATLHSEKYDAVVLSPFLSGVLREFSGSLNGTLRVEFRPPEEGRATWGTRFSGRLGMTDGVITPTNMGLRLEETSFDVSAGPEGALNAVHVENLKARARSDTHNLTGRADLYFQDLELVRGHFELNPSHVPLLSSGVKLADLTGRATATLEAKKEEMDLALDLPELTVELPENSDRELIDLSDNPTVHVLQPLAKPEEIESTGEKTTPWNIRVHLGSSVKVRNRMLNLGLIGDPVLRYDDELAVRGRIELVPGGRTQVLGRVFVVDHGAVVFDTEDNTNPHLDVSATWRAPNGVLIRANVGGTAKKPELSWSSEPPLPGGEAEVIAVVLGGSGGSRGGDAGGVGLSTGAAAVNELLGQSGVRGVEFYATRQTSQGGGQVARLSERTSDNYTAAFQVSDELWFEGSYRQERSGPQSEPRSGFSGTLDWRFHPDWSARTEVGTLGFGADLLWQYRY